MKRSSFLRVLVATTFAVAPLSFTMRAEAAPSLPLPAPAPQASARQKASAPQSKPNPAPQTASNNNDDADAPYIAPPNVDIPLRRNAPNVDATDNANANTSSGAGPLPQIAPIPARPNDDLARDNSSNAKGASVGGVSIEGLSDREAFLRLRRVLEAKLRAPVALSDGQKTWMLRRDELGAMAPLAALILEARRTRRDIPLRFDVDTDKTTRTLRTLSLQVNRVTNGHSDGIVPVGGTLARGSQRLTLSVGGSAQRIRQALESRPPRVAVDLDVDSTPVNKTPESSTRNASDKPFLKKTPYLLAEFSTPYDSSIAGRTTNLKLAARNVDGTIVQPGKVFSTNLAIGRRDEANGWKEAKMFMDGQVVDGVGSGICQCASTLYNAALLAGLPIIERHPHTFRVSYAPASRDATIYWGSKDFRFRNNTPGPIYVRTYLRNDRFHVELYGVQPVSNQIEIASHVLSRKNGTRSEAFRIIKTSTGETTEKLSSDFYRPHP